MAHSLLLQDWNSIKSPTSAAVTQGEDRYLDISAFQDVVIYPDVADYSTALTLAVQTGPTKDDAYFKDIATYSSLAAPGLQALTIVRFATASVPPARWLRWRTSGTGAYNVTFRIWISGNPCGSR